MALMRPHRLVPILFWRALGKRVRARGRLDAALAGLPFAIERLMAREGKADLAEIAERRMAGQSEPICVHLHVSRQASVSSVQRALKALARQSEAPLKAFVTRERKAPLIGEAVAGIVELEGEFANRIDGLEATLREAKALGARWLVPTTPDLALTPHALAAYHAFILRSSGPSVPALIYGDTRESAGATAARVYWLKPQWDPRMALSQDYVTQGCALAVDPALSALEAGAERPGSLYALLLRIAVAGPITHLARVVAQTAQGAWRRQDDARPAQVQRAIGERGTVSPGVFGTTQVQWSLPVRKPTVSVIIATRDRLELLRTCVEGVLHATDYPALDVIIADNESVEPETLAYMKEAAADPRVQVVRWPHPFNYSAINNYAVRHAAGEYICLLNNDIEVIEPQWLTEMMREAVQPGVGAVGARLLYPDRSIQHAGVAIGIGNAAGHAHRGLAEGEPGYFAQALIARGASAVTAACLVVRKDHFDAVGGLDEEHLAVAYNDVDLCLKLQELGLSNIYTPLATLIHHESKSRGLDFAPEHLERYMRELRVFQERWGTDRLVDPWHHPGLDRGSERY